VEKSLNHGRKRLLEPPLEQSKKTTMEKATSAEEDKRIMRNARRADARRRKIQHEKVCESVDGPDQNLIGSCRSNKS